MPRRLLIAGHSREGLELLPVLEANPMVEVAAILTEDPSAARGLLEDIDVDLVRRFAPLLTQDIEAALASPGLVAVIDADAPPRVRERLNGSRGLQVVTPGLARTLFAFGPVNAFSKPDLLQILREILLSAELTRDHRSVLDLVLQVAVAATGADRGSLLLWDEHAGVLRVAAALGIEEELLEKIRVAPGDGIAGRAFVERRALLLHGKADRQRWQILRERDDVESAISAPLLHGARVLGVLNLSHAKRKSQFDEEDLRFVEELAQLDARILARADEFGRLLRDSQLNRLEAQLRRALAGSEPLCGRLHASCALVAESLQIRVAELWLSDPETGAQSLRATSRSSSAALSRPGPEIVHTAAAASRPVWLAGSGPDAAFRCAALPLLSGGASIGVLLLQGERDPSEEHLEERWTCAARALEESLKDALIASKTRLASLRGVRLAEAMVAFSSCRVARELHDLLVTSALVLLDAEDAVLRLRHDGSSRFPIVAWSGSGGWRRPPMAELERKLAAEAARSRRAVRTAAGGGGAEGVQSSPLATTTGLVQPLLREGWVAGSLCVLGKATQVHSFGESFDADDEIALGQLARYAQMALAALGDAAAVQLVPAPPPDRRALRERLGIELARSRARGHRVVLVEIEMPGLGISSEMGAEPVALEVAASLRESLREFDLVACVGPDRFAALVPEPEEEVPALLARLHGALRDVLARAVQTTPGPSVRMGYAVFPDDGGDVEELESRASEPRVEGS